jgi:putative transposase
MIFKKAFKYRLVPNKAQETLFLQFSGARRWIYNRGLSQRKNAYEKDKTRIRLFDQNNDLPKLKKQTELSWLKEVHSQILQQALHDLDKAYQNFFRGLKTKEKIGYPRFKCKGMKDSFRYPEGIKVKEGKVYLPKIGHVKFKESRKIEGSIKQATVLREGKYWYISFSCEIEKEVPKVQLKKDNAAGIDLGLKSFATLAVGKENRLVTIENPKILRRSLKKLRYLSTRLSKKVKKGKNRYKAILKLSGFHSRVKNLRLDFFNKLALEIVKSHDIIGVEKMQIKNMMQALRTLSRAIGDAGWGMFIQCLKNKALEYGKTLYEVSSLLASTRTCSNCGCKKEMNLGQREYLCECGNILDRDLNAAINIKNLAVGASV